MKNSKSINESGRKLVVVLLIFTIFFLISKDRKVNTSYAADSLWPIRSIDTMKTSRDMARAKLNDLSFNKTIDLEVDLIKEMGANYIALGTPYDEEFLPYLKRWVASARRAGLHVWYRGSFSGFEGWFGYPKKMTPDELLSNTQTFIEKHPDMFSDEDIFDPCPECENAGFWKQPLKDNAYNQFMKQKNDVLKSSFEKINKQVIYNLNSVIGGRAKDVLVKDTFDYLGNVIALDHYNPDPDDYDRYIHYFSDNFNTNVVFSEFGAPIPDMHGKMTEQQQSDFIAEVLTRLYRNKEHVRGLNYWVLSNGTTSLVNANYTPRKVVNVIKDYFYPGTLSGIVKNTFSQSVENITVETTDGYNKTVTDTHGNYRLVLPPGEYTVRFSSADYEELTKDISVQRSDEIFLDTTVSPKQKGLLYSLRLSIGSAISSLFR